MTTVPVKPVKPATTDDDKDIIPEVEGPIRSHTLSDKLTNGKFDDSDADDDPDQRGWISGVGPDNKPVRIPVRYWERFSRIHNL